MLCCFCGLEDGIICIYTIAAGGDSLQSEYSDPRFSISNVLIDYLDKTGGMWT